MLIGIGVIAVAWADFGAVARIGAIAAVVLGIPAMCWASDRVGWRLPEGIETVGDVVRAVAPIEFQEGSAGERLAQEYEVLEEVRRLTSEELCVPLEMVRPNSDLCHDLGMD